MCGNNLNIFLVPGGTGDKCRCFSRSVKLDCYTVKRILISLFVFFIGNIITYLSPNFTVMMIFRVLTGMSTALVVVLSLTIATRIVNAAHQAKALGLIYMGISSSLVLGVPLGILISGIFGWRVILLCIAALSVGPAYIGILNKALIIPLYRSASHLVLL